MAPPIRSGREMVKWVGFFANRRLQKVAVSAALPSRSCDAADPRGATWADDDTIIFTPNASDGGRLYRVSSAGGEPKPLIALAQNEATQRWPQWLPGANAILFTSYTTVSANYNDADIVTAVARWSADHHPARRVLRSIRVKWACRLRS